jgi:cullin 3
MLTGIISIKQEQCVYFFLDLSVRRDRLMYHIQAPEVEISVIVMTTNSWPTSYSTATCIMPPLLLRSCKSFENFYLSRHSGRRLTWVPGLGNADVRVAFKSKSHELNVTTFALVILLLFQDLGDDGFLTYEVLQSSLCTFHRLNTASGIKTRYRPP